MGIIAWIIVGGIAGWLASLAIGRRGQGILMDILVGIVGGILGGIVFRLFGGRGVTGFNLWSIFVAFIGALVLLFIVRLFTRTTAVNPVP